MKTIPFDIEKAKLGARIVNKAGQSVRILSADLLDDNTPIVIAILDAESGKESISKVMLNDSDLQLVIDDTQVRFQDELTIVARAEKSTTLILDLYKSSPLSKSAAFRNELLALISAHLNG